MKDQDILELYDEARRMIEYPGFRRERTPRIVRDIPLVTGTGAIVYSRHTSAKLDEAIREQIAYFQALGHDFEWKVYDHDQPEGLKDRLAAYGFEIGAPEAFLVLDIETAPKMLLQPISHDVHRITKPEDIPEYMAVTEQVWPGDHSEQAQELAHTLRNSPEQISIYVVYADGRPVSSARSSFYPGSPFAGLWGGATLPAYRQQGLYTTLIAVRLQEARERGVRFLTVDALPTSRPILERHGFRFLTYTFPCVWHVHQAG